MFKKKWRSIFEEKCLPLNTPVPFDTAMDTLELVFESVFDGYRLLGELHPRGVGREGVEGAVAGSLCQGIADHSQKCDEPTPQTHIYLLFHPVDK